MRRKYRPRRFTSSELPERHFAKSSAAFVTYWYRVAVSICAYDWLARNWPTLLVHGLAHGDPPYEDKSTKRAKAWTQEAKASYVRPIDPFQPNLHEQLANARIALQRLHPDKAAGDAAKFIKAKRIYDSLKRKLKAY